MAPGRETEGVADRVVRDHRATAEAIRALRARLAAGTGGGHDDPVFAAMRRRLLDHMRAEEALLYPGLERELAPEIAGAKAAHAAIRRLLEAAACGGTPSAAARERDLEALEQAVARHAAREERMILRAVEARFGAGQLRELGDAFDRVENGRA